MKRWKKDLPDQNCVKCLKTEQELELNRAVWKNLQTILEDLKALCLY